MRASMGVKWGVYGESRNEWQIEKWVTKNMEVNRRSRWAVEMGGRDGRSIWRAGRGCVWDLNCRTIGVRGWWTAGLLLDDEGGYAGGSRGWFVRCGIGRRGGVVGRRIWRGGSSNIYREYIAAEIGGVGGVGGGPFLWSNLTVVGLYPDWK